MGVKIHLIMLLLGCSALTRGVLLAAVSVSTPGAASCWASGCKGAPCSPCAPLGASGTMTGSGAGAAGAAASNTTPLLVHHQRTYSFPLSPLPPSTSVRRGSAGTRAGLGLAQAGQACLPAGQRTSGTSLIGTSPSNAHCTYCMPSTFT